MTGDLCHLPGQQQIMPASIRLLVVGNDDTSFTQLFLDLNQRASDIAIYTATPGQLLHDDLGRNVDTILIDDWSDHLEGPELCRALRVRGIDCPTIVRSKVCSDSNEILALQSGANDFVTIEMAIEVLIARIRAHAHSYQASGRARLHIGEIVFDPTNQTMMKQSGGRHINLTNRESDLLKYLYLAKGRVVGFDELKSEVWRYGPDTQSHTVSTHISKLKQKISLGLHVKNVLVGTRVGYRIGKPETETD